MKTRDEVVDAQEEAVVRDQTNVEGEQNKELLVPLSHTVVNPRTVMVHLFNTSANNYIIN